VESLPAALAIAGLPPSTVAAGTTLFASKNPRDYDVTPGRCGVVTEQRSKCQPFILADNAPGSGV
jgi:polygalacturonase